MQNAISQKQGLLEKKQQEYASLQKQRDEHLELARQLESKMSECEIEIEIIQAECDPKEHQDAAETSTETGTSAPEARKTRRRWKADTFKTAKTARAVSGPSPAKSLKTHLRDSPQGSSAAELPSASHVDAVPQELGDFTLGVKRKLMMHFNDGDKATIEQGSSSSGAKDTEIDVGHAALPSKDMKANRERMSLKEVVAFLRELGQSPPLCRSASVGHSAPHINTPHELSIAELIEYQDHCNPPIVADLALAIDPKVDECVFSPEVQSEVRRLRSSTSPCLAKSPCAYFASVGGLFSESLPASMPALSSSSPVLFVSAPPGSGKSTLMKGLLAQLLRIRSVDLTLEPEEQRLDPKLKHIQKFLELLQTSYPKMPQASGSFAPDAAVALVGALLKQGVSAMDLAKLVEEAGLVPIKQKVLTSGDQAGTAKFDAFKSKLQIHKMTLPLEICYCGDGGKIILVVGNYSTTDETFSGTDKMHRAFKTSGGAAASVAELLTMVQGSVVAPIRVLIEGNDIVTKLSRDVLQAQGYHAIVFPMATTPLQLFLRDRARRNETSMADWLRRLSNVNGHAVGHAAFVARVLKAVVEMHGNADYKIYLNSRHDSVKEAVSFILKKL